MSPSATLFPATNSSSSAAAASTINTNISFLCRGALSISTTPPRTPQLFHHYCENKPHICLFHRPQNHTNVSLRVTNESSGTAEVSPPDDDDRTAEADKIVDSVDFGELCNEFECISSPAVESTARQLVRDILQLRQGNRALGSFAISVKYKDPVRSFTGRDKYKRQLWATDALDNPTTSVQQMVMLSTSELNIKWTIRGKPKSSIFSIIGGELIVKVDSNFTLNQISGQVIEHKEVWDLSASSSPFAQAYFWTSRRLFATFEAGKDFSDFIKDLTNRFTTENKNVEMYPDPSGDPTKFFQTDDSFQRDFYQIALFLAVGYFVVQFLRTTL